MQGLLKVVNHHVAAISVRMKAPKTRVMNSLILGEQWRVAMLDGEPLEDVDKFKYLGSMFMENGQGTEDIRC